MQNFKKKIYTLFRKECRSGSAGFHTFMFTKNPEFNYNYINYYVWSSVCKYNETDIKVEYGRDNAILKLSKLWNREKNDQAFS